MHRNQRKLYRYPRTDTALRQKEKHNEVEEVYPPKSKRLSYTIDRPMTNRCCNISPEQRDAAQCTDEIVHDQYQNLLLEQYGFDPIMPDTIDQIKEIKKVICGSSAKIETGSQCDPQHEMKPLLAEAECGFEWQDIDNADEVDKFLTLDNHVYVKDMSSIKDVEISENPNIKIIAEKFLKYKKNNIEVRKLEEKIVCIEYDVFNKNEAIHLVPVQKLRAYFSIKLADNQDTKNSIPSSVKLKYKITNEDLNNMNDKEVEIIDGKIPENRAYLEDLKKILKRKQDLYEKKRRQTVDLISLYEMAKKGINASEGDNSDFNFITKAELEEIKHLITNTCASSIHGISRKTIKSDKECEPQREKTMNVISESIFNEVLRNIES